MSDLTKFYKSRGFLTYELLLSGILIAQIYDKLLFDRHHQYLPWLFFFTFFRKYQNEGLRHSSFFSFTAQLVFICNNQFFNTKYLDHLFYILNVTYLFLLFYFPTYELPEPSGRFPVGHIDIMVKDYVVAIYYPSSLDGIRNHRRQNWLLDSNYLWCLYEFVAFNSKIPYIVFQWVVHFFRKVQMHAYRKPNLTTKREHFTPIVFSHGLCASRFMYSSFTVDLASKGNMVFALEHKENMLTGKTIKEEQISVRREQLEARYKCAYEVLDFISVEKNLEKIFKVPVKIDLDKLTMIGHSFGGVTSIYTAMKDDRIKGVVAMDPWLEPLPTYCYDETLNQPIFSMCSEFFQTDHPEMKHHESITRIFEKKKERQEESLAINCYVKGLGHNNPCDIAYLIPQETYLTHGVGDLGSIDIMIDYHRKFIEIFLDQAYSKKEVAEQIKESKVLLNLMQAKYQRQDEVVYM